MATAAQIREEATYHLRRANNSDEGFLLELYAQGRAAELTLFGLDAMQRAVFVQMQFRARQLSYTANYPMASDEIICSDSGTPIGRVLVDRTTGGMRLVDIALVAVRQRQGFGTRVIRALQQECAAQEWNLKLQVLKGCAAESLYKRLGFEVVGEDSLRRQMVWDGTRV